MPTICLDTKLSSLLLSLYTKYGQLTDDLRKSLEAHQVETDESTWDEAARSAINISAGIRTSTREMRVLDSSIKRWLNNVAQRANRSSAVYEFGMLGSTGIFKAKSGDSVAATSRAFELCAVTRAGSSTIVMVRHEELEGFKDNNMTGTSFQLLAFTVANPLLRD